MKDKLICHIIVLCLFIFGFKFDGALLAQCMKLEINKFITYVKECGCTVGVKEIN